MTNVSQQRAAHLPRAERERQIVAAAIDVFSTSGFHAAAVAEIARRVGVRKPLVHAYFGNKDALYLACLEDRWEPLVAAFESIAGEDLPADQVLWRLLNAYFELAHGDRASWVALQLEAQSIGGAAAARAREQRETLTGLINGLMAGAAKGEGLRGMALDEIETQAQLLHGAIEGLAGWSLEHPDAGPALLALRAMNFAWMGFDDLRRGHFWLPLPEGPR